MLITFTTKDGALVIRGEDLRRIEDRPGYDSSEPDRPYSLVTWLEHDAMVHGIVQSTAEENLARIIEQEYKAIADYEAAQRRAQNGLPVPPVARGRR